MAFQLSTGARNALAVSVSLRGLLTGNVIRIYGGAVPADADAAIGTAVLLCTVSGAPNGIEFEAAAQNGAVVKLASQTWQGANVANGTATFCRVCPASDTGSASATAVRMQGTVGQIAADLELSSVDLVSGAPLVINSGVFTVPARS